MASTFALLTRSNPKIDKGKGSGYWTFALHLAPGRLSGFNVCPKATAGCLAACLNTAGRGGILGGHKGRLSYDDIMAGVTNTVQAARLRRTRWFYQDRAGFMRSLVADCRKAVVMAARKGLTPVFRLNATSDIRWESVPVDGASNIMALFPEVQFYDYTKLPNRKRIPANYHLTFSLADGNDTDAAKALQNGINVAAVFRNKATVARYETEGFLGHRVVNGDETDLRFLDPANSVVALYAKGNARHDTSGFVRD